jgi:RND family efflux transporter MFP subunit
VKVTVEGESSVYTGRLVRVSPSIEEDNRTLLVEAEIPNEQGVLRPGSFARAEILGAEEKPAVFVPSSSITSFAGIEKVTSVKDGKVVEIRVKTGRRDADSVEIIEGLQPGTPVIVQPGNLVSGQSVTTRR